MRPTATEHPRSRGRGGKGARIIDRTGNTPRDLTRPLRKAAGIVALVSVGLMAPALGASPMPEQLPGSGPSVAPEGSGLPGQPVAPAPAPAPVAAPVTAPAPADALRPGTSGSDVKALQRKLRVRGIKVPVDGNYGARTRAGVRILQRKLKMKATGIADAALLAKLGLKIRAVASDPALLSAPATARYLKVFPVVGDYSYEDDFGDPRGQGPHQGNDVIGTMGMQLVSCVDGTISRLTREETGLGGIWIWIVDGQGNEYYYAHMASISPELKAGSKVTAGQFVGTMGMTGDARGTVPHLHFEIRPNGGGSINPFTELRAVDPKKK